MGVLTHPGMDKGVALALGSMVFAGTNDLVFRAYGKEPNAVIGLYIASCGAVWTVLSVVQKIVAAEASPAVEMLEGRTFGFGIGCGLALAGANLLIVESMRSLPASVGSTVYRLNTVGVILGGVLLLGEEFRALKAAGVALAIVAVLVLYRGAAVA